VTQGKLLEQLHELGIDLSAGELSHLLTDNHEEFHKRRPRYSQPVCNRRIMSVWTIPGHATRARTASARRWATSFFAYFESSDSTSRLNF